MNNHRPIASGRAASPQSSKTSPLQGSGDDTRASTGDAAGDYNKKGADFLEDSDDGKAKVGQSPEATANYNARRHMMEKEDALNMPSLNEDGEMTTTTSTTLSLTRMTNVKQGGESSQSRNHRSVMFLVILFLVYF